MSVLFVYGLGLLSHPIGPSGAPTSGYVSPAASMSVGTADRGYGPENLIDGVAGVYSRANEITAAYAIDLGSAKTPQLAAVFNHNIDPVADCHLQATASPSGDFSVLTADVPMTPAQPAFWVDLRSLGVSARWWRLSVTSNTANVKVGEFVLGRTTEVQSYQWGYQDSLAYLERMRGATDYGTLSRTKHGIKMRKREVRFVGPDTVERALRTIDAHQARSPWPVVFVPDDASTDVWLIEWPDEYGIKRVIENRREVTLPLMEQSPGLLTSVLGGIEEATDVSTHRAHVYLSATINISDATPTVVPFDSEVYDVGDLHDNAVNPNRITIVEAGWYLIIAQASWLTSSGGRKSIKILVDGTIEGIGEVPDAGDSGQAISHPAITFMSINAGSYIEAEVRQDSGGVLGLLGGNKAFAHMKVIKLPFVET